MTKAKKKQVIWHIGDPKTGTSSIQHALRAASIEIEGKSIACYSPDGIQANAIGPAASLLSKDQNEIRTHFKQIEIWVNETDADYLVVSAETFSRVNPRILNRVGKEFLAEFWDSVRVIYYCRPHSSRFLAAFAQRVKTGDYLGNYEDLAPKIKKQGILFFARRARVWQKTFGDRFIVRPFSRSELYQNDAVADFVHVVHGNSNFKLAEKTEVNQSVSLKALSALQLFHGHFQSNGRATGKKIGKIIAKTIYHQHFGTFETTSELPKLDDAMAAVLYDTYLEDAQQMDAEFFDGKPFLVEALAKARDTAKSTDNDLSLEAHYSQDEIIKLNELTEKIEKTSRKASVPTWMSYVNFAKTPDFLQRSHIANLDKKLEIIEEMDGLLSEFASVVK